MSKDVELKILEAEGELNKQITASLLEFRRKVTDNMSTVEKSKKESQYDINKAGPQKIFKFRQSLLTMMFETRDFKTLYNMVVASFCILTFCLIYDSYITHGNVINVTAFLYFFRGSEKVFLSWWIMAVIQYGIILITKVALITNIYVWLPLYLIYLTFLVYYPISVVSSEHLGFASVFIIMCEGIRMLMKSHSYFRTKLLYIKQNKYQDYEVQGVKVNQQDRESPKVKITMEDFPREIKRFSYFFIAPTLIYRDHYTLTPLRSLSTIFVHFVNFMACIYYSFMLYITCCKENIENLQKKLDFSTFLLTVIRLMMPSVFFLILGFFGFLHSWLNMWAEITRFPDRAFYSDWWNSNQFGSYYRKWNIVVHDWLYYYIYVDSGRFFKVCRKFKVISKMATFIISALIHEFIMCVVIGFFYPILFMLFTGPGIILIQNQKNLKSISINLLFWLEMYIGTALLFSFYLVEIFAREVVQTQIIHREWGSMQMFIPRTFYLGH